ncbi:MAG: ABC transporter substrate-binding protein, partial [Rhizomicrobium sp.]
MAARNMRPSDARRRSSCRDAGLGLVWGSANSISFLIILLAGPLASIMMRPIAAEKEPPMGEERMRLMPAAPLLCRDIIDRRALLRLAAQAGVAVLGVGSAFAQQQAPFKVGWIRPTTGRLASSFAPLYFGGLIAVDEINAAGGILGRPIARVEEDDEASPAKEPGIVRKLRDQD